MKNNTKTRGLGLLAATSLASLAIPLSGCQSIVKDPPPYVSVISGGPLDVLPTAVPAPAVTPPPPAPPPPLPPSPDLNVPPPFIPVTEATSVGSAGPDGGRAHHAAHTSPAKNRTPASETQTIGVATSSSEAAAEVGSTQQIPCEVTDSNMTTGDCEMARRAMAAAHQGIAKLVYEQTMRQLAQTDVALIVGGSDSAASAVQAAASQIAGHGKAEVVSDFKPMVGARMQATLTGTGFKIDALTDPVQLLQGAEPIEWHWKVTAQSAGTLKLIARTTVTIRDSQGREVALKPTTETHEVQVSIGLSGVQAFVDESKGLIASLTGVLVALIAFRKKLLELLGKRTQPRARKPRAKPA